MFYPFPRQTQRCAPPPAPCLPAVFAAQPPAPLAWPQQCANPPAPTGWPQQRSDQPSGWPEEDGAASSLDDDGSEGGEEELVFNDEFLHGFVALEGGDASSRAISRRPAAGPAASNSALPQREDEASRAAQREARQRRQQQELRYGPRAPQVRALEAALNERFDRVSQAHAPALWPSVPFS